MFYASGNKNISMKYIIGFCIFIILFNSCQKNKSNNTDYLIFGHFYGECIGESCVEIFKLTDQELFEDKNDFYPNSSNKIEANFEKLESEKYLKCETLLNSIPENLWQEEDITIGIPDAGDWGGIYVEYHKNGKTKFWLIDQMKSNVPDYLHSFIDEINDKIILINE